MTDETKIERVLRLRRAYTKAVRERYEEPLAIEKVADAAGAWVDAENELDAAEYAEYQRIYQSEKGENP